MSGAWGIVVVSLTEICKDPSVRKKNGDVPNLCVVPSFELAAPLLQSSHHPKSTATTASGDDEGSAAITARRRHRGRVRGRARRVWDEVQATQRGA